MALFPEDSAERKTYPVFSGLIEYFPSALALVARHSYHGNEKHNPGQPLNHDRSKSGDEADALIRHLMEGDYVGMAWRALALLQKDCEAQGAPIAPAATNAVLPASQCASVSFVPDPKLQALLDRSDEDAPTEGLNFDKAHDPDAYASATVGQRETGE